MNTLEERIMELEGRVADLEHKNVITDEIIKAFNRKAIPHSATFDDGSLFDSGVTFE